MITTKLHNCGRLWVFLFLLVLLFTLPGSELVWGEAPVVQTIAAGAMLSSQTGSATRDSVRPACDIVLLMDSSGSMKHTDPHDYRKDAAKLFVSLIGRDDRIGVMSFGDAATMLLPLTENRAENRASLFNALRKISSREFSTNILEAVQRGFDELKVSTTSNKVLIMLSDGKLALGSPEKDAAANAALIKLLPELQKAGIRLYTVAFTRESDAALLETLARETGGFFRYAETDTDVHLIFASIFEKLKSPDAVPFEGESFVIDRDIKEAIVLISRKAGTAVALVDPAGTGHRASKHGPALQWYQSNVFDMITISEPAAGKWSVKLSAREGNKVYVLTDLKLKCSFEQAFVSRGATVCIDAWLEKQGMTVTEKDIVNAAAFSARITGPDAKTVAADLASRGDGRHFFTVPASAAGEYTVTIVVDGKTFKREKTLRFTAREATAPPTEAKGTVPSAAPAATRTQEGVPWTLVLLQFGLINLALLTVGGALYFIMRLTARRKVKP